MNQKINNKRSYLVAGIIVFLTLLSCFAFAWLFFPLRVANLHSPTYVNNSASTCFWERDNEYNCFWERGITSNLRGSFESQDDFNNYLDTNFRGCFNQVNPFLSGLQNGLVFIGREGEQIENFRISDDVCVEYQFDLLFEDGQWKIDNFGR